MKNFWVYVIFLFFLNSCSVLKNEKIYEGTYENDDIALHFENSKKGILVVNNDSIPFEYKIETIRINPKTKKTDKEKVKVYIYRFTLNADYELSFPFGFFETGQKRGDILQGNNGLTLVRKRN